MEFGEGGELHIGLPSIFLNQEVSFFFCDDQRLCLSGASFFPKSIPATDLLTYLFISITGIFLVLHPGLTAWWNTPVIRPVRGQHDKACN